ncbi:MAG: hypothetical protein IAE86_21420 [Burkholderiaceae bacterium]|nr:hypothetical protein [Burkholderiaceae bacterium]
MNDLSVTHAPVSQDDINGAVWAACDTFRGTVDPSIYKDYVLTMLFLSKRSAKSSSASIAKLRSWLPC